MQTQPTAIQPKRCASNFIDETAIWSYLRYSLTQFPDNNKQLLPGMQWGSYCQLFTPSFWKFQYLLSNFQCGHGHHRLSVSLVEEIVMCILGGYGISSEMGILAFNRLKTENLCSIGISYIKVFKALSKPFKNDNGKEIYYRFANQKSKYIHALLNKKDLSTIPTDCDLKFRSWLLDIDGIGLKTASWITRNWLSSNKVAILDIHLLRAGLLTGFFKDEINVQKDYLKLERQFLKFCEALDVFPSDMDAVIWSYMKKSNKFAIKQLNS